MYVRILLAPPEDHDYLDVEMSESASRRLVDDYIACEAAWDEQAPRVLRNCAPSNPRNKPLLLAFEQVYAIVTSSKPMRPTFTYDYRLA